MFRQVFRRRLTAMASLDPPPPKSPLAGLCAGVITSVITKSLTRE